MNVQRIKEFLSVRNTMKSFLIISIVVLLLPNYIFSSSTFDLLGSGTIKKNEISISTVKLIGYYSDGYNELKSEGIEIDLGEILDGLSEVSTSARDTIISIIICPYIFIVIPLLMVLAMFFVKNNDKAINIGSVILSAINIIAIYKFMSALNGVDGVSSYLNASITTSIWFKIYIFCFILILVFSLLLIFNKLELSSKYLIDGIDVSKSETAEPKITATESMSVACCSKCGNPIKKTSKFCIYCGTPTTTSIDELTNISKVNDFETTEKRKAIYTEEKNITLKGDSNNDGSKYFKAPPSL